MPRPPLVPFRERLELDRRVAMAQGILVRRPQHLPVIVEAGEARAPPIDRERFLLPPELTGGQLSFILRKRMPALDKHQALFLFCNRHLITSQDTVRALYERYRDEEDGFLYVQYALENVFG